LNEENQDLSRCFKRLNRCIQSTAGAAKCNETCLAIRRKKVQIGDTVNDRVDIELHKEKDLLTDCNKQLKQLSAYVEKQLDTNEAAKKALMRDWTLKQEAIALDNRSASMGTDHKLATSTTTPDGERLEYRDGAPLNRMSEYPEWVENTAINLNQSARARVHSRKLTQVSFISLHLLSALPSVIGKDKEVKTADIAINEIQLALKQKGSPLQVALSRQTQRGLRPGIELCNDKAQHALHAELMNLKSSLLSLEHQLEPMSIADRARESRKKLEGERFKVRRKLEICDQNLAIDNEILRSIRTSYPQEIQLAGFLISEN
uniref:Tektin n=1 Tax=Anisakis simplex TaxID=6269 RepID=A0A158PP90_ANISI